MQFRGDRLRSLRENRKTNTNGREGSQNWVANRIGAHVTSLSDWERGANEPSGRHVASLAREFGVEASYFYGDDEDEEAAPLLSLADQLQQLAAIASLLKRNPSLAKDLT